MRQITRIALVILVLIAVAQPKENSKAQSWLKHDCPQTQMENFLSAVQTQFILVIAVGSGVNSETSYMEDGSNMSFVAHTGHAIDQMEKPNCYDATQVVNVSYWIITALSELYFGGLAIDSEVTTRASEEVEQGISAMNLIYAEYGLSFSE